MGLSWSPGARQSNKNSLYLMSADYVTLNILLLLILTIIFIIIFIIGSFYYSSLFDKEMGGQRNCAAFPGP
jgi:hypothetical protein